MESETATVVRIKNLLGRLCPPPEISIPRMTIEQLLDTYRTNCEDYVQQNSPQFTQTTDQTQAEWPASLKTIGPGIHYFHSDTSELVESLSLKLVDHFVGRETFSSFSTIDMPQPKAKRKPLFNPGLLQVSSPRRRLSHLAKRRAVFSSVTLKNSSTLGKIGRQIQIAKQKITPTRNKRKRTPKRRTPIQQADTFKRSLFQSPADDKKPAAVRGANLQPADKKNPKRALFLSDDDTDNIVLTETNADLPLHHRQKLLWAVAVALKNFHVSSSNPSYKLYAYDLSKVVKHCFLRFKYLSIDGTSAKMKRIANCYVQDVIAGASFESMIAKEARCVTMMKLSSSSSFKENEPHQKMATSVITNDTALKENVDTHHRQRSAMKVTNSLFLSKTDQTSTKVKRQILFDF